MDQLAHVTSVISITFYRLFKEDFHLVRSKKSNFFVAFFESMNLAGLSDFKVSKNFGSSKILDIREF